MNSLEDSYQDIFSLFLFIFSISYFVVNSSIFEEINCFVFYYKLWLLWIVFHKEENKKDSVLKKWTMLDEILFFFPGLSLKAVSWSQEVVLKQKMVVLLGQGMEIKLQGGQSSRELASQTEGSHKGSAPKVWLLTHLKTWPLPRRKKYVHLRTTKLH